MVIGNQVRHLMLGIANWSHYTWLLFPIHVHPVQARVLHFTVHIEFCTGNTQPCISRKLFCGIEEYHGFVANNCGIVDRSAGHFDHVTRFKNHCLTVHGEAEPTTRYRVLLGVCMGVIWECGPRRKLVLNIVVTWKKRA